MIWFKVEGIIYSLILILILNLSDEISKKIKIYSTLSFILLIIFKLGIYQFFNANQKIIYYRLRIIQITIH